MPYRLSTPLHVRCKCFKEFREQTVVFFLVAWFGSCSAEKQQSFHEFVFAWHMFCFAEKLKESNFQLRRFTQQFVQ